MSKRPSGDANPWIFTANTVKLGAVYGEVDVGTLVKLAYLLCHHLGSHKLCRGSAILYKLVAFVGKGVAASAEVFAHKHLIVGEALVVCGRAQILYLLWLAVDALHDVGVGIVAFAVVALQHNVLSAAIDNNLWHSHIAVGCGYCRGKYKLVVGGHLQLVEVEGHRQRKLLVSMAHPYILHLYAAVGY